MTVRQHGGKQDQLGRWMQFFTPAFNDPYTATQSAYRTNHSIEAAMPCHNINFALDNHDEIVLVLLDSSSGFESIGHGVIIKKLCTHVRLSGSAWIDSYLDNSSQSIVIKDFHSSTLSFVRGVSQGSVLGPSDNFFFTFEKSKQLKSTQECAELICIPICDILTNLLA